MNLPFRVIWLNGMPRSGTNWLCQIFDSNEEVLFKMAPLFSYSFKNAINRNSTRNEWMEFFAGVYDSKDDFIDQVKKRTNGDFPVFSVKSEKPGFLVIKDTRNHQLTSDMIRLFPEIKIIHIVRNPCGAIYSWLSASNEFPSTADPMQEWRTGNCRKTDETEFWGYNDWKSLTHEYLRLEKEHPGQVKVISYEELVKDSSRVTRDIFNFSGLKFSEQSENFLIASQSRHSDVYNAVFKDKSVKDKWRQHLHPHIIYEITKDLEGSELEEYLHK